MAKQKIDLVSVVFVVGLMAIILCTGAGFFKNFAVETNALQVTIPSSIQVVAAGDQCTISYSVNNPSYGTYYTIYCVVNGVTQTMAPVGEATGAYYLTFSADGTYAVSLHVMSYASPDIYGDSNTCTVQVGPATSTPTPTPNGVLPTPTVTGGPILNSSILQQILNFLQQVWNTVYGFVKSLGLVPFSSSNTVAYTYRYI